MTCFFVVYLNDKRIGRGTLSYSYPDRTLHIWDNVKCVLKLTDATLREASVGGLRFTGYLEVGKGFRYVEVWLAYGNGNSEVTEC